LFSTLNTITIIKSKQGEIGGTCGTYGKLQMHAKFQTENLKERGHFETKSVVSQVEDHIKSDIKEI
jgi:hypothetical protein